MIPTSMRRTTTGFSMPPRKESLRTVNTRTIAIFMKLLATKIVAKSLFGFLSKAMTRFKAASGVFSSESYNDLSCKEKNATSVPEISAEHNSSMQTTNH